MNSLFFELVRVSIGTQSSLSRLPSEIEWNNLYKIAKNQSLIGVCFAGIQATSCNNDEDLQRIGLNKSLFLKWLSIATQIQAKNEKMTLCTKQALTFFRDNGFACTSLKGQGMAALYCANLKSLRQSGDIDIWIAGGRKNLFNLAIQRFGELEGLTYHHIHFPMFEDVEVEAHVWPSFLSSPRKNKKLHSLFKAYEPQNGCDDTPSLAFNRVFILLHCYQHFTRRGVGMRQLLDYFFVLSQGFTKEERNESMYWISSLGMSRFAGAMMWICNTVFGLKEDFLLCKPDDALGRFLLEEVLLSGNMGHADQRVNKRHLKYAIGRYFNNLKRDIRIIKICPHEALWEPFWGLFQFVWCKIVTIKYKHR